MDGPSASHDLGHHTRLFIWTTPFEFRLWWVLFLLFHGVCAAYHGITSYVYHELPNTGFSKAIRYNNVVLSVEYHPLISNIMALLAGVHGITLVSMVAFSIHAKKLMFVHIGRQYEEETSQTVMMASTDADADGQLTSPRRGCFTTIRCSLRNFFDALYGQRGLFHIEGKHFDTIFAMRETIEIVLQIVQAYRLALYVPRPWLVRGFVALLVLSCWSTPLMHRIFKSHPARERMACLLLDVSIDFISTIVIPVLLAVPYIDQFDTVTGNFPIPKQQDTEWRALAMNEFRLILISSWLDLFTRVLLCISSVSVLFDVKTILRVKRNTIKTHVVAKITQGFNKTVAIRKAIQALETTGARVEERITAFLHLLLVLFGFGVLAVHGTAGIHNLNAACALRVISWGTFTPGCAYVVLNCSSAQISGSIDEMSSFLSGLDPASLQAFDISDCPYLHMPPVLQSFNQLSALKIRHSSIAKWGADAALTARHHPYITHLMLTAVQMPSPILPPGMTDPDFPQSLGTVVVQNTTLHTLPTSFPAILPPRVLLLIEFCDLFTVTDVLPRIQAHLLSLAGNQFATVPASLFYSPMMQLLDLSGNPISELPEISEELQQEWGGPPAPLLKYLDMSATQLRMFPVWLQRRRVHFIATRTPLCDRILAQDLTLPDEQYLLTAVDCRTWSNIGFGH